MLHEGEKDGHMASIQFEAQNLGSAPTSIRPVVSFIGFLPRPKFKGSRRIKLQKFAFDFMISEKNARTLQPYTPVLFEAYDEYGDSYRAERHGSCFLKCIRFHSSVAEERSCVCIQATATS
jgi:hypothetical protein